jgi:hypothetical protein
VTAPDASGLQQLGGTRLRGMNLVASRFVSENGKAVLPDGREKECYERNQFTATGG